MIARARRMAGGKKKRENVDTREKVGTFGGEDKEEEWDPRGKGKQSVPLGGSRSTCQHANQRENSVLSKSDGK